MSNLAQVKPIEALKTMLSAPSISEQFKNALGDHKDAFVASLIDLYSGDAQLQNCKPQAVIMQALRAATLRLPLNKALGFSYIVVFNNSVRNADGTWEKEAVPTFLIGYKGLIQLALRTGQYRCINADVVYEGELRKTDKLTGAIDLSGTKTSNDVIGYFCHVELINGFSKTLYMTIDEMAEYALRFSPSFKGKNRPTVEQLKSAAKSGNAANAGWQGNFDDMALKTVTRRLLSKYGYLSVEMQGVVSNEAAIETEPKEDFSNAEVIEISEDGEILNAPKTDEKSKPTPEEMVKVPF